MIAASMILGVFLGFLTMMLVLLAGQPVGLAIALYPLVGGVTVIGGAFASIWRQRPDLLPGRCGFAADDFPGIGQGPA